MNHHRRRRPTKGLIRDTGPKQKRLTPAEFAKALGAKRVGPSPRTRSTQTITPPKKEV